MLRQQDRLIACELHVEDFAQLKRQFRNDRHVQIHHRDGYEALGAFLPPEEKRGLVLIDPPYESIDEFSRLARAIIEAHKRWPQGIFMLWYPVKDRPALWQFHETLAASGIPKQLCAEFIYEEEVRTDRLNGCGFVFINPPWRLDEQLTHLFPALHQAMQTNHDGSIVKWLVAG
jgi:23S rRNA (adenine2030-N6)-methyltransferase